MNKNPNVDELLASASIADVEQATLPPHVTQVPPVGEQETVGPKLGLADDATLPPAGSVTASAPATSSGRTFGDYELIEEIARGGMGVVYKARQKSLNRVVALKMILTGQLAAKEDVQRFYAEAEAAANLDHPGIVPIYEVGQHEDQHYFSMAYVDGGSLATKLKDGPLPPHVGAAFVEKVSRAIAFAHERGVIHRDLKPGNVLLDHNGEPKVTDFGLAKKVQGGSELTSTGQIIGTPSYMPPEQAAGKVDEIKESADIYSLGAILYALITGRPPFQADNPLDTLLQVLEREPVPPRQLNPKLPADLETICLKCLEKAPARRYPSAQAVADELSRYQRGEPILARPITSVERGWRWCRRKPVIAAMTAAIVLVSVLGLGGIMWQWRSAVAARTQAIEEQKIAEQERNAARAASERSLDALVGSLYQQAVAVRNSSQHSRRWKTLELLESAEKLRGRQRSVSPSGTNEGSLASLSDEKLLVESDLRSEAVAALLLDDARLVWQRNDGSMGLIGLGSEAQRAAVPWTNLGSATPAGRFGIALVDLATGKDIEIPKNSAMYDTSVALSGDGKLLACVARTSQKEITIFEVENAKLVKTLAIPAEFVSAKNQRTPLNFEAFRFTSDGKHLVAFHFFQPSMVLVWNVETGAVRTADAHNAATDIALSENGQYLAFPDSKTTIALWDLTSDGQPTIVESPWKTIGDLALSPTGNLLAIGGNPAERSGNTAILLWDPIAKEERWQIDVEKSDWTSLLKFSSDGAQLAVARRSGNIALLDLKSQQERFRIRAHRGQIKQLSWRGDSLRLWSQGADGTLACWDLVADPPSRTLGVATVRSQSEVSIDPQSGRIGAVISPPDSVVRLINPDTGKTEREYAVNEPSGAAIRLVQGNKVVFRNDGKRLAFVSGRAIVVWDDESAKEVIRWQPEGSSPSTVTSAAFDENGDLIAAGIIVVDRKSKVVVWKLGSDQRIWESKEGVGLGCLSPDAKSVALWSALMAGPQRAPPPPTVIQLSTGREVSLQEVEPLSAEEPVFSPDGRWLASMCGPMRGMLVRALGANSTMSTGTGAAGSYVSMWSAATGERKLQIRGPDSPMSIVFSPDSRILVVGYRDGSIEFWEPTAGALILRWQAFTTPVWQVLFAREGADLMFRESPPAAESAYGGFRLLRLTQLRKELAAVGLDW